MNKEILCTLGPASLNERTIKRLDYLGVSLLRINLSHTKKEDIGPTVEFIRRYSDTPICLDSEGAQIRTGTFRAGEIFLVEGSIIKIYNRVVAGDETHFNLYPFNIIEKLAIGDILGIDFNSALGKIIDITSDFILLKMISGGKIGSNKAVALNRNIELSPFTDKDLYAFELATEMRIPWVALSFAQRSKDVTSLKEIFDGKVMAKIECRKAIENLPDIVNLADAILIDRGDMSREIPIERIPALQKYIVQTAQSAHRKVYIATNLLESMVHVPFPTRAEVNDIFHTLDEGADGVVMAAETAIGKYPERCVEVITKLIHEHEHPACSVRDLLSAPFSLLIEPHGGTLVDQNVCLEEQHELSQIPVLILPEKDILDCQQISVGTFSPLTGFMGQGELNEVLENFHLPSGVVWTLPVFLQLKHGQVEKFGKAERIIVSNTLGSLTFLFEISSVFRPDLQKFVRQNFGTDTLDHPGVRHILQGGEYFISGKIWQIKKETGLYSEYVYTPREARYIFDQKGWSRVVGFHTRNVAHRVHEFIQIEAIKKSHADGLYITPVIGPKKKGDFLPRIVLESYQKLIQSGIYPPNSVLLGAFSTYSRYAGPREAVFTALCRKNMGCSHFIVGRDHTGVGNFYAADASHQLLRNLEKELGIEIIFFEDYAYNPEQDTFEVYDSNRPDLLKVSGTAIRDSLTQRLNVPTGCIREVVWQYLQSQLKANQELFFS
jgi:ATP sulfurylase